MSTALSLGTGVFWTLAYVLIIRQSFRDRTYGMPLAALCANLSWEFIFAFVYPHKPIQRTIDIVWFAFDVIIFAQLLRYGPREFPDLPKRVFYTVVGFGLVTGFSSVLLISVEFNDWQGVYYAFGSNLLMSVLFIGMLYRRRSPRGQSLGIAMCKLIGTACASLFFYLYNDRFHGSALLLFLFISIVVYDLIYVGLVWQYQYARGAAPFGLAASAERVRAEAVAE